MRFSGAILGSAALAKALGRVAEDYEKQYAKNLKVATLRVHGEAVKSIRETSSGRSEKRYGPTRVVQVSKPGDPPNTDKGTLLKSVGFNVDEVEMVSEVGTNLKSGKALEFGTSKMKARPWLFPALERVKRDLVQIFRQKPKIRKGG